MKTRLVERVCAHCKRRTFKVLPTSPVTHCGLRCREASGEKSLTVEKRQWELKRRGKNLRFRRRPVIQGTIPETVVGESTPADSIQEAERALDNLQMVYADIEPEW